MCCALVALEASSGFACCSEPAPVHGFSFPKLKSLPGLKDLLGDCDFSWLPCVAACATATAASFFKSWDLRNFRKPGSWPHHLWEKW